MPDNGVILVVTNAGSHELKLVESIKEKSLKKNVKIYFAFSPFCYESCDESLPVYKRLSDGRMFNNSDFSRDSFFKTVVYTVWKYSEGKAEMHVDCSLFGWFGCVCLFCFFIIFYSLDFGHLSTIKISIWILMSFPSIIFLRLKFRGALLYEI